MIIYLDNASTTAVHPEVYEAMKPFLTEKYANPSSLHFAGREIRDAVELARKKISEFIGCKIDEIIFTSGATESNALVIIGIARSYEKKGKHIITSAIEHHSILNVCEFLKKQGFEVSYVPVDSYGIISPDDVRKAIRKDTILITIMHSNNEIGTLQPIQEIAQIARDYGILIHSDVVQSLGRTDLNFASLKVDSLTFCAHKTYGPKGVGALVVRKGVKITPLFHGGAQEYEKRPGTENVPGIIGFSKTLESVSKSKSKENEKQLRDLLERSILEEIEETNLNGHPEKRLHNITNITFRGVESEALILTLDNYGVCVSSAAACTVGPSEPSHVLLAMGLSKDDAESSIRFSLGMFNTREQIERTIEAVKKSVNKLRSLSRKTF